MKTHPFVITLILAISLFSCKVNKKPKPVVITGKVKVNSSNQINLRHGTISLAESWSGQTDDRDSLIALAEDGIFKATIDIAQPRLYSFSHEQQKVEFVAFPGDSIHIDLTAETVFSGSNSHQNNHMNLMTRELENIERHIVSNQRTIFQSDLNNYNATLDSLNSAYLIVHKAFKEEHALEAIYDEKIVNDITFRTKFYQIIFPAFHEMYTGDTLKIDQKYFDELTEGTFDDPTLLEQNNFVLFLDRYLDIMAGQLRFRDYYDAGIQKITPKYEAIQQLKAHQEIKEYLMNEHLKKSISNYGISYLGGIMPDYIEKSRNPVLKQQVLDMYEENKKRRTEPDTILIYKKVGNIQLEAHVFHPSAHKKTDETPVYAFFHGVVGQLAFQNGDIEIVRGIKKKEWWPFPLNTG